MSAPSDQRALATRLPDLSDAQLSQALSLRSVSASAPWRDWFDAAEALLDAASIDRALARLPRSALVALHSGAPSPDAIAALLSDDGGMPYAVVRERVTAAASTSPEAFAAAHAATEQASATDAAAAAAAERVFGEVGALADVVLAATHAPFVRTGTGTVSALDRRRLVEAAVVGTAEELEDLVAAGAAAGLLQASEREWVTTETGAAWLSESTAARWSAVVEGLRAALPPALRTPDGGYAPIAEWHDAYPLNADWPARAAQLTRLATAWGLALPAAEGSGTETADEPAWATPLRHGAAPAVDELTRHLPAEIDRVYLQADLTAIAPGPLAPALDLRLRGVAHRESRAQASTYRFSAESISAALTEGETADAIRDFLSELSLTGIPQPLAYLLESASARHGRVTVRTDAATGRTRVASDDAALLASIEVDQTLRPLGLVADGVELASRVTRDAVYWSLADARYPVLAVDSGGEALSLRRGRLAGAEAAASPDPYARLIETLRGSAAGDGDAAWLDRELDLAVRSRATIAVDVRLPDGTERTFTLEAAGLGGGRLRGRDRSADIERTLPVASIVSVRPA